MPLKILVIDDERPTLSMFKLFLDAYGFEVYTAENGDQGIELFCEHNMPIVLTDIKMPGMDGLEVLRRIKEISPKTEVIIITGHGDMDLAIKALGLDATDFINKPIQQRSLDAALKRAQERIQLSQSRDESFLVRHLDGIGVIEIKGTVNSGSEESLRTAFASARADSGKLVLSFSENTSINGAGIALLTQLLLDCRKDGTPVAMAGLSSNFTKVLTMVGMTTLATLCETEADALRAV
ncbi:MAG: response regulator [Pseudodesulfovibrio sp.]|uniref:Response regulator receiver n=1 Tax=Pseudodesulfovibrio aespoeensis (strain ATCC 700646 / DSM 10631 / Aspo-2) TaxID=643562 RepID=E6VY70_PSEA9|nr:MULTISPECIES: response regulator [Pseudodesulfovibrio]MBU4190925.1 response regulator [Pseudomonadota bacterium]ADU63884.1 response regulator receiver [Pseudodesulfovibrio aespoeensis Aspo-2]MBU4378217.1 response regulator [Pseudomonadota bacterium]MBU4475450.1 response regulator [Pseudomonadota bacterium]MBU4517320.1 response regulator [Pseudomonadota bacterium]